MIPQQLRDRMWWGRRVFLIGGAERHPIPYEYAPREADRIVYLNWAWRDWLGYVNVRRGGLLYNDWALGAHLVLTADQICARDMAQCRGFCELDALKVSVWANGWGKDYAGWDLHLKALDHIDLSDQNRKPHLWARSLQEPLRYGGNRRSLRSGTTGVVGLNLVDVLGAREVVLLGMTATGSYAHYRPAYEEVVPLCRAAVTPLAPGSRIPKKDAEPERALPH